MRSASTPGTLNSVQTAATFRLSGDATLTAAFVTRRLGVVPTKAFDAGTPVGSRSGRIPSHSQWSLSSQETDAELHEQLGRLLQALEPVTHALWELTDAGYVANWFCWVASHATEHAVELDRGLLTRLLALPGDLWLDVCGDGEDDGIQAKRRWRYQEK